MVSGDGSRDSDAHRPMVGGMYARDVLPHVVATRYVTPLREGGSLPGLMEADDLGMYVVKFRGAGQGLRALVAEVIAAGIARGLGLPVPDLATVTVDGAFAAAEPDEEIQALLRASVGMNLGIDFLPGALDYDAAAFPIDAVTAGRVLWFDALLVNVDRSHRNPNLLQWHGLRCIDHGATLPFHHRWETAGAFPTRRYDAQDHVLLPCRPDVMAADAELAPLLVPDLVAAAVADVPEEWLEPDPIAGAAPALRLGYIAAILDRLTARDTWLPDVAAQVASYDGRPRDRRTPRNRPAFLMEGPRV